MSNNLKKIIKPATSQCFDQQDSCYIISILLLFWLNSYNIPCMSQMLYPKFIPNILFIKILLITSSKKKLKLNPNIYFEDSEKIQKTEERTTPYRKNTRCNVWAKQNNFRTNNPNVNSQL